MKYNVYLSENAVKLQFRSTDRGCGELAARLLKLTGVSAEVKSKGDGGGWYVRASKSCWRPRARSSEKPSP